MWKAIFVALALAAVLLAMVFSRGAGAAEPTFKVGSVYPIRFVCADLVGANSAAAVAVSVANTKDFIKYMDLIPTCGLLPYPVEVVLAEYVRTFTDFERDVIEMWLVAGGGYIFLATGSQSDK